MRSATRSVALRARGFAAISRSRRPDRAADERERRRRQRRRLDGKAREPRIAAEGLRRRQEEALHDPVLERMKADDGEAPVGGEHRNDLRQDQRELRELAIDENPKSLERPRGRILTPITPRARADGFGHDRGQLPRALDGCDRASRNNCSCNRLSKPFFTIVAYHLRQFARGRRARGTRRPIRRASDPSACRAGRRRETRSRAPDRRSAERKCRGREARRRCVRRRARRAPRGARKTSSSRRRTADRAAASALAAAAGSRSKAKRRPAGASDERMARACPPRPKVASTYVPSGSDRQRGDGFLEQDGDVVTVGSSKAEAVQLGRQSARRGT